MSTRKLDRRTVVVAALIAAIIAGLAGVLTWTIIGGDDTSTSPTTDSLSLTEARQDPLDVPIADPDGNETSLGNVVAAADGKPVLVNLWQSTCAPCVKEMPLLDAAQADHPDVAIVGVATLDRPEDAAKLAEDTAITYPWFLDEEGDLSYALQGTGMPTTVLLDPKGKVLATETGAFADAAELDAFLEDQGG